MEILDQYITSAPSIQNALDIFKGEWASKLPGYLSYLEAGQLPVFEDPRILWPIEKLGINGKTILELGPLEAGHTYMLEKHGAAAITSVEANTRAYLKCLIIKETMGLSRTHFLCGDFVEYLRNAPATFDICFASGVLYHMINPAELIGLMSQVCDQVFIWTHYYDAEILTNNSYIAHKFPSSAPANYQGFAHTLYRYEYQTALDSAAFCGGSNPFSHWMSRADILNCLQYFGLTDIEINFESLDHPNGPSFAITATRPKRKESGNGVEDSQEIEREAKELNWELQQVKLELKRQREKLENTETQLQETQEKLTRSHTELEQTQHHLKHSQEIIAHLQQEIDQVHTRLHQTQLELVRVEAEVHHTHRELGATQLVVEHERILLKQTQQELQGIQEKLVRSQTELQQTQQALNFAHQEIAAMKTSKFWKLRNQWFKLKNKMGLIDESFAKDTP